MIPIVELIRLEENALFGTFGVLKINKQPFCLTLEPPDKENVTNISSIPAQQYECERYDSPKHGETFKVMNVPGRKHILFGSGNLIKDTKGCILLAQHFAKLKGNRAIVNSGNTFKSFMKVMGKQDRFHLTIREVY